ncbi:hypothetical protein [Dyadobacter sandarakinus]|uniref:Uncharacterized protein n=1 Tax=Dyadobacter sandarakinus TaxID=2747268 RepID=A0ABX7IAF0_9BACT|nr:hypothetical protein [Dyadobacter sandarakinus]QRR03084.1 hypothetical protein HWI92_20295 [Dyadobacter sandarakinus]
MQSDYDRVTNIEKWKTNILYLSTIITLSLTIDEKYEFSKRSDVLLDYVNWLIGINSIFVFVYVWMEIQGNLIFSKAERNRTLQYVDNSFDTNFAGKKLDNYFTQDKLSPGFYKFSVNCFENTFHTFNIVKQMQLKTYAKAAVIFAVFMFSATVGEKGMARYLIESILPLSLIQQAIKLAIFVTRLDNLLEVFSTFFSSLRGKDFTDREPEALKNVITYETILAWASIPLDSKVFTKMRDELADEWSQLKISFSIE